MELDKSVKRRRILAYLLVLVNVFFAVAGFILSHRSEVVGDVGKYVVSKMYNFTDISELPDNYLDIHSIISEEDWERISLDNDWRAINTYYKFNCLSSEVHFLDATDGFVAYRLINGNISGQTIWWFLYDTDEGRLKGIREYRMTNLCYGGEGVW